MSDMKTLLERIAVALEKQNEVQYRILDYWQESKERNLVMDEWIKAFYRYNVEQSGFELVPRDGRVDVVAQTDDKLKQTVERNMAANLCFERSKEDARDRVWQEKLDARKARDAAEAKAKEESK
jgi:hypothetical protein